MGMNQFDRLPDDLLRLIFNRVVDVNSLCCCICVSKRFASLVPQTKAVSVVISRLKQSKRYSRIWKKKKNIVMNLVRKLIIKPLQSLHHQLILICNNKYYYSSSSIFYDSLYLLDHLLLKTFNNQIESLQIILPPTDRLSQFQFQFRRPSQSQSQSQSQSRRRDCDSPLLKWKAEFGSQLKNCVILSAASLKTLKKKKKKNNNNNDSSSIVIKVEEEEESSTVGYLFFYEEMSLLEEIFSFIHAASMTHESLSQIDIIGNGPMLGRIEVVTDDKKQGRLCMNQQQIVELRNSDESRRWGNRSRIPFVRVEFRYVPGLLELPSTGKVMEGVSLVLVRAVDDDDDDELLEEEEGAFDCDFLEGAFNGDKEEEVLNEAVREMMKKRKTFSFVE